MGEQGPVERQQREHGWLVCRVVDYWLGGLKWMDVPVLLVFGDMTFAPQS